MILKANLINIKKRATYPVAITVSEGKISKIEEISEAQETYILPGFVDAHIHIESSMLVPSEFARLAVVHGSVGTVSDPHEIGNVLGVEGVEYMIENGRKVPFKFNFGAPSCVPATTFETAGAEITSADVEKLLKMPEVKYLTEMMNWPGVLYNDKVVYEKIAIAKRLGKPIDGHAPGLKGEQAKAYIDAGISTDHECFTAEEALDKLKYKMKILIREGSAAKNFEALIHLIDEHYELMMFCSDDKHPDELMVGHLDVLVKRALAKGHDLYKVLQMACVNPVEHYKLDIGLLEVGDDADFIVVDQPTAEKFNVLQTYIDGELVAENGKTNIKSVTAEIINNFNTSHKKPSDFQMKSEGENINVIEALDGELITNKITMQPKTENGYLISDVENDILKFTVINRYADAPPAVGFIKNFGLKSGALASSVGHDSHNILAVGVDDKAIAKAVNLLIDVKGGVAAVSGEREEIVPLPVAGLMSNKDGYEVGKAYANIDKMTKEMGSTLLAPYMTLSFMALLVIPSLKLSDLGLFDGDKFEFVRVSF